VKRFTNGGLVRQQGGANVLQPDRNEVPQWGRADLAQRGRIEVPGQGGVDVHQHLWPPEFVDALRARNTAPRLVGWTLHLAGEPPYTVDPAAHEPHRRSGLDRDIGRIVLGLSSPLGIEDLLPDDAEPLLLAWHKGILSLPEAFVAWAAVSHVEPDLSGLRALLDEGFVGLQVPANRMATPQAIESLAEVLRVCEQAGRPVLVHPGPVTSAASGTPAWWAPVVDYATQLQTAWWAWQAVGRSLLPHLRICFVAGAGLAPLHYERSAARGGPEWRADPDVFVDTSSYGRVGLDSLVRVLGVDALVLGSDRPYSAPTDPGLGAAATHAVRVANPRRLLQGGCP
jgi:hypothetical protein